MSAQLFYDFITTQLNEPQRQAVTTPSGAVLVIAGAGSGKTRVITARIAQLVLHDKVDPASIVALTFTNKAAGEMKERLVKFLGGTRSLPFVGTFHGYALLLLRANPSLTPFGQFSILDGDDQEAMLKRLIKQHGLEKKITASQLSYHISHFKNKLDTNDDLFVQPMFKELAHAYEMEKGLAHSLDFDDLILYLLAGFKNNKEFKEKFQRRVKHLLVDEYQDTSTVQHDLLKQMSCRDDGSLVITSVCAVGDEDQSIYSWRGAMVTNMLKFNEEFAPVRLVKIEQNYRSVQPILEAANAVITNNRVRTPKTLWSDRKATGRILTVHCQSGYQEADIVASLIQSLPKSVQRKEVAILYRTHFQSRSIEEALLQNSIPYYIVGGIRFYERKEIKDLLAYLRLVVNPFDRVSFFRVINTPTRGIGAKAEGMLLDLWNRNPFLDFKQLLETAIKSPVEGFRGVQAASLQQFLNLFNGFNANDKASQLLADMIKRTEYISHLRHAYEQTEADTKIENVQELLQSVSYFEQNFVLKASANSFADPSLNGSGEPTLETFLHEVALIQEKIASQEGLDESVQLMTLHAVKGLEFEVVIIVGLEEGLLPSTRSLNAQSALEEERRLFYVGMTRAKERLILLRAQYRNSYGQVNDQLISRFLSEVPDSLVQSIDATDQHISSVKSTVARWCGGTAAHSSLQTFSRPTTSQTYATKTAPKAPGRFSTAPSASNSTRDARQQPEPSRPTPSSAPSAVSAIWKKNRPVHHPKFGTGVIKAVEKKDEQEFYITAVFKAGEKKILSSFLKPL